MKYRMLGDSGFEVSVMAFGAWQIADRSYWGEFDPKESTAAVHAAFDAGINLFDTAESYTQGESEKALGAALGARRGDVFVATKVSPENCEPGLLRAACEASLKRLNTDWIDLYQIHWPPRDVPFATVAETMLALQQEGKIRAVGVSNFGPIDTEAWTSLVPTVSNQLGYNLLFRAIEFATLPRCQEANVGILAYMPLMQGLLAGKWTTLDDIPGPRKRTRHFAGDNGFSRHGEPGCEALLLETLAALRALADEAGMSLANLSLAATLAKPGVTSIVTGGRRVDQIERNVAAVSLELGNDMLARIDDATAALKARLGSNCDFWVGSEASRIR